MLPQDFKHIFIMLVLKLIIHFLLSLVFDLDYQVNYHFRNQWCLIFFHIYFLHYEGCVRNVE